MKMQAVSLLGKTEIGDMKTRELDQPSPSESQVLIKMYAAGINPMDWESASGDHAWVDTFPHTLGNEGAGEIVALGKSVKGFKLGEKVIAYNFGNNPGMFAQYNVVEASQVARLPDGFDPLQWAASPIGILSVYHAFYKRGLPKAGTRILIEGTGGVGVFAIQWAKKLGMEVSVLATARSQSWAKELGAHEVLSPETIESHTGDFDIVFSTLGLTAIPRLGHKLAKNGRFISTMPIQSKAGHELADYAKIGALSMDAIFKQNSWEWFLAEPDGKLMDLMLAEAERLGISCPVAHTYGLSDASKALVKAAAGGNRGKIVLSLL